MQEYQCELILVAVFLVYQGYFLLLLSFNSILQSSEKTQPPTTRPPLTTNLCSPHQTNSLLHPLLLDTRW